MPCIVDIVVTHPGLRWSVLVGFEAVSGSNGRQTQQDEDLERESGLVLCENQRLNIVGNIIARHCKLSS